MPTAISTDGGEIFYRVDSLVPPWTTPRGTILMHHGVALTGDAWCEWLPATLAARYRIIRLDMRGFGRSQPTPEDHTWSFTQFRDDIDAVLAAETVDEFHYVGESLGGMIGLDYAARRSNRVLSCALLSTPFDGSRIRAVSEWRGFIARHGMQEWSDTMMQARFAPGGVDTAMFRWVGEVQANCSDSAVAGQADFITAQDLSADLCKIAAPVLILSPDGSPFVDRSMAADLHAGLPTSEIQWFPGQRHSLLLSRGAACAEAYVAFLERRTGSAAPAV